MTKFYEFYEPIAWIGRTVLSRDGSSKGEIIKCSARYCAACGYSHPCWVVKWDTGNITKPCIGGVYTNEDGVFQIR